MYVFEVVSMTMVQILPLYFKHNHTQGFLIEDNTELIQLQFMMKILRCVFPK